MLEPRRFGEPPPYSAGLTDIVRHAAGTDGFLSDEAFGVLAFRRRISQYQRAAAVLPARTVEFLPDWFVCGILGEAAGDRVVRGTGGSQCAPSGP